MQAVVNNAELRLAVPSTAVRRIFALTGLDRLMPVYPSLGAALTDAGLP
jgi:anti-anti-sigma regulatory factor